MVMGAGGNDLMAEPSSGFTGFVSIMHVLLPTPLACIVTIRRMNDGLPVCKVMEMCDFRQPYPVGNCTPTAWAFCWFMAGLKYSCGEQNVLISHAFYFITRSVKLEEVMTISFSSWFVSHAPYFLPAGHQANSFRWIHKHNSMMIKLSWGIVTSKSPFISSQIVLADLLLLMIWGNISPQIPQVIS